MSDNVAIGVDVGGTKTLAVAYSESDTIIGYEQFATKRYAPPEVTLMEVANLVRRLIARLQIPKDAIVGIGVGVAGLVSKDQIFIDSIILPTWVSVDIGSWLSQELQTKVVVDNDATMAARAEWWGYRGKALETMLCLTLGTGVGGAVIINGQPLRGPDGTAGQLGHITVDLFGRTCACGSKGCLNAYVSGTAIMERYLEQALSEEELSDGERKRIVNPVTSQWVFEAAQKGDSTAKEIIEKTSLYLGAGLASLVNVFNPDAIILTGGVLAMGDVLLDPTRAVLASRAFHSPANRVIVKRGRYGTTAGAMGAAVAVLTERR